MSSSEVESVLVFVNFLKALLGKAKSVKPGGGIEPALTYSAFEGELERVGKNTESGIATNGPGDYAAIETACRNIFYDLLASTSIDEPSFSEIWNLLDIVSIMSDTERCEPGLVFWLVEELLDSQTIDGCRVVFDYLDSRRKRLTAKHFKQKQLIILRACNELLRRLSRAEDTVFCGRVFIFMFQSFPLGDRSSVNLRGEYHTENVTTFDKPSATTEVQLEDNMDTKQDTEEHDIEKLEMVDAMQDVAETEASSKDQNFGSEGAQKQTDPSSKAVKFDSDDVKTSLAEPDNDTLYPIFWSLQDNFSQPTQLFEDEVFRKFKDSLELTLRKFRVIQLEQQSRGSSKIADESKTNLKRKRGGVEEEMANSFNPRYLTSRDLFDLEISDLAFRRHILVQALILVDFLLGLTAKAKKKLENASNKSVLYTFTLGDEDAKWANAIRTQIASYLQQGQEGKFYYRMVDTVLSRDKNWVRWKAEGCPLIERPSVSAADFEESKKGAQKAFAPKRLRATPMGTLDLTFLTEVGDRDGLEKLKQSDRYTLPTLESFKGPVAEDDFDLEMAKTDQEREVVTTAKESKLWRALRIASKNKVSVLDKIEDANNLQALFEPTDEGNRSQTDVSMMDAVVAKDIVPSVEAAA